MGSAVPLLVVRWRPLTCPLRPGPDTAPRVSLGAHPPRRVEGALHGLLVCGERRRIRERPRAGRSVFSDHDQDDPATRGRPRDEDPLGRTFEQPEVGHAGLSVGRAEHATTAHVKSCSPVVRRARIACCPRRAGRLMGYTRVMSDTVRPPPRPDRAKRSRPLGLATPITDAPCPPCDTPLRYVARRTVHTALLSYYVHVPGCPWCGARLAMRSPSRGRTSL